MYDYSGSNHLKIGGNVHMASGARFDDEDLSGSLSIGGNLDGDNIDAVILFSYGSAIGGDVTLTGTMNEFVAFYATFGGHVRFLNLQGPVGVSVYASHVKKNLHVQNSAFQPQSGTLRRLSNRIDGQVQLFNNNIGSDAPYLFDVTGNSIGKNLNCQNNSRTPIGSNSVGGQKLGQCAGN